MRCGYASIQTDAGYCAMLERAMAELGEGGVYMRRPGRGVRRRRRRRRRREV